MVVHYGPPESPDNKSIREQLGELKKLNQSSAFYSKLTIIIGTLTLLVSLFGVMITVYYASIQTQPILDESSRSRIKYKEICSRSDPNWSFPLSDGNTSTCSKFFPEMFPESL